MTSRADSRMRPMAAMRPPVTPTSPRYRGCPAPSTTQPSGRRKERRRRRPANSQGKEIRDGLLDVRPLHLATTMLLPPGVGGLDSHQVGSEQGRVGFEKLVCSPPVRLVGEPEKCDGGV